MTPTEIIGLVGGFCAPFFALYVCYRLDTPRKHGWKEGCHTANEKKIQEWIAACDVDTLAECVVDGKINYDRVWFCLKTHDVTKPAPTYAGTTHQREIIRKD